MSESPFLLLKSWKRRVKRASTLATNYLHFGTPSVFTQIFIDTITSCNRRCHYCPNARYDRGLISNQRRMSTEVYCKIIDDLSRHGWRGEVAPNYYGEPLLDDRLCQLIQYTRENLHSSPILLYTNGDYLTLDTYKALVDAGVTSFVVTQHGSVMSNGIERILDYRNRKGDTSIQFDFSRLRRVYSRGGAIDMRPDSIKVTHCDLPKKIIGVDHDGNVILCCNDYFSSVKLGNVRDEDIFTIWKSRYYSRLRDDINADILDFEICKQCYYYNVEDADSE